MIKNNFLKIILPEVTNILQANEPWLAGNGDWKNEVPQSEMKTKLVGAMTAALQNVHHDGHTHEGNSAEHVEQEHRTGAEIINMLMFSLNYE